VRGVSSLDGQPVLPAVPSPKESTLRGGEYRDERAATARENTPQPRLLRCHSLHERTRHVCLFGTCRGGHPESRRFGPQTEVVRYPVQASGRRLTQEGLTAKPGTKRRQGCWNLDYTIPVDVTIDRISRPPSRAETIRAYVDRYISAYARLSARTGPLMMPLDGDSSRSIVSSVFSGVFAVRSAVRCRGRSP
jgi:hypothetical protein